MRPEQRFDVLRCEFLDPGHRAQFFGHIFEEVTLVDLAEFFGEFLVFAEETFHPLRLAHLDTVVCVMAAQKSNSVFRSGLKYMRTSNKTLLVTILTFVDTLSPYHPPSPDL